MRKQFQHNFAFTINHGIFSSFADGSVVLFKEDKQMAVPMQIMGLRITKVGLTHKISLELIGLTIYWDAQRIINIEATAALFNRTAGLCGTLDQDPSNDFTSKDGTVHKVFRTHSLEFNC